MVNPYFLMMMLYLFVAVLAALDASLISLNLLPWFNGVRWLRIHFITLGRCLCWWQPAANCLDRQHVGISG